MIKKIAIGLLAFLNFALLITIVISVLTGWHFRTTPSENNRIIAESSSDPTASQENGKTGHESDDDDDDDDDYSEYSYDDDGDEYDADNDFVADVTAESIPDEDDLLEYGHALRGCGRAKAQPHIAPAEEHGIEELEKAIERALKG